MLADLMALMLDDNCPNNVSDTGIGTYTFGLHCVDYTVEAIKIDGEWIVVSFSVLDN